jgi:hypothetical protein
MFLLHGQSEAGQLSWFRCSLIALGELATFAAWRPTGAARGHRGHLTSPPRAQKQRELSLLDDVNVVRTSESRRADLSSVAAGHIAAASGS